VRTGGRPADHADLHAVGMKNCMDLKNWRTVASIQEADVLALVLDLFSTLV
jgi:hypothetical protein